jgi:hypothetical protein
MYPSFVLATTAGRPRALAGAPAPSAPAAGIQISRETLAWLLGRVADGAPGRRGLGQFRASDIVGPVVEKLMDALTPRLMGVVAKASEAAEPMIRTVVREELAPKVGMWAGFALLAAGLFSGIIGAYFASRSAGVRSS